MAGMTKTIYVSRGFTRNVGGIITDEFGTDIHTASFQVAAGDSTPPTAGWVAPSVNTQGATAAKRIVKMLIDDSVDLGTRWVWCRFADALDIEPIVLAGPIRVA